MTETTTPENACWQPTAERGFLIQPDPLRTLADASVDLSRTMIAHLETLGMRLPDLMASRQIRRRLDDLPVFDMTILLVSRDCHAIERAFQLYSYFATAYVHAPGEDPAHHIPAGVAVPLVHLARAVQRPPILAYAAYTLNNWRRLDPTGPIEVDNLALLQQFIPDDDAAWFTLIHVEIEAEAGPALQAVRDIPAIIARDDPDTLESALQTIRDSLKNMMTTFDRMPEGCDPDIYYHRVRPYMFGFDGVVYEGVTIFRGAVQHYRGETGAQSTIIPLLIATMGLQHEETALMQHLRIMQDYMPQPHRAWLQQIDRQRLRAYIQDTARPALRESYNETLQRILDFRRLHLKYAGMYIADRVENPQGTGGTIFMSWLQQLIDETATQMLRA